MKTAAKILKEHGLRPPSDTPGRYYTTCPKCSSARSTAHQDAKVIGITIDEKGVQWGCNHCAWTGGEYYNGKANGHDRSGDIIATYDYVDETGALLFQVCRKADKGFPQRRANGNGGWIWETKSARKVLYRLPEVIEAIASGHPILIVEGEKDANAAWSIGLPATCNPGGASEPGKKTKWRAEYSETLLGADIVIIPDHDEAGYAHAESIARMSLGIAKRVRVLKLAEHWPEVAAKKGGDLSDGLAAGHTREEIDALIENAPAVLPGANQAKAKSGGLEDSVALDFAGKHADDFRFIACFSKWMKWDGGRWRHEDTLRAFDASRKLCREAGDARARTVAAVVTLARTDRAIAATENQWDTNNNSLNAVSATIDLLTGESRRPERLDYITMIAAASPAAPGTPHPRWTAFLDRVTAGNADLIGFLQRYAGYCLTGDTSEQVMAFFYGLGGNGKGVFINTISRILGDYAVVAPMELFMASQHERHPTEIAKLRGARLVTAQETQKGRRWDVAKIKNLTSSDTLTGRFMRQDFFDFTPTHKLIVAANHKPVLRSIDEAISRRFLLVPFTVQIPRPERDLRLEEKIVEEWPAILRWMIDGCLEWRCRGLRVPAIVRQATEEYLADQDATAQWIEEWIEHEPRAFTTTTELFKSWRWWCEQRNHFVGTERAFSEDLADRGFEPHRMKYGRGFKGLLLRASNEPRYETPKGDAW